MSGLTAPPVRAVLLNASTITCGEFGVVVRSRQPVFDLCLRLRSESYGDLSRPLFVYRDGVLVLRIASVEETAVAQRGGGAGVRFQQPEIMP
jgi:hypothetical protein